MGYKKSKNDTLGFRVPNFKKEGGLAWEGFRNQENACGEGEHVLKGCRSGRTREKKGEELE